ncbi:MAG: type II toxin-antitoxin system VapC family toxin [Planctomycetota bacterium]
MSTFVVDTHALVWYIDGDDRLSGAAEASLDDGAASLVIPTIVLAEVRHLFGKRRIRLSFEDVVVAIEADARCVVYPFDFACVQALDERLDLHDGIIVATAVVFRNSVDPATSLVTRDRTIQAAGIVKTVW